MKSYFAIDNFFSDEELAIFERAVVANEPGCNSTPSYGPFANQLIANYVHIEHDIASTELIKRRFNESLSDLFGGDFDKNFHISCLMRVRLFLPWDIHNDLPVNTLPANQEPMYNMLVPLHDVESRTILFNQSSTEYRDFYIYKQNHQKVKNPIDEDFWNENLSMCWPEDRLYVTLLDVLPYQRRGQLLSMMQSQFHSSDNFHTRGIKSKDFLQIRINAKK